MLVFKEIDISALAAAITQLTKQFAVSQTLKNLHARYFDGVLNRFYNFSEVIEDFKRAQQAPANKKTTAAKKQAGKATNKKAGAASASSVVDKKLSLQVRNPNPRGSSAGTTASSSAQNVCLLQIKQEPYFAPHRIERDGDYHYLPVVGGISLKIKKPLPTQLKQPLEARICLVTDDQALKWFRFTLTKETDSQLENFKKVSFELGELALRASIIAQLNQFIQTSKTRLAAISERDTTGLASALNTFWDTIYPDDDTLRIIIAAQQSEKNPTAAALTFFHKLATYLPSYPQGDAVVIIAEYRLALLLNYFELFHFTESFLNVFKTPAIWVQALPPDLVLPDIAADADPWNVLIQFYLSTQLTYSENSSSGLINRYYDLQQAVTQLTAMDIDQIAQLEAEYRRLVEDLMSLRSTVVPVQRSNFDKVLAQVEALPRFKQTALAIIEGSAGQAQREEFLAFFQGSEREPLVNFSQTGVATQETYEKIQLKGGKLRVPGNNATEALIKKIAALAGVEKKSLADLMSEVEHALQDKKMALAIAAIQSQLEQLTPQIPLHEEGLLAEAREITERCQQSTQRDVYEIQTAFDGFKEKLIAACVRQVQGLQDTKIALATSIEALAGFSLTPTMDSEFLANHEKLTALGEASESAIEEALTDGMLSAAKVAAINENYHAVTHCLSQYLVNELPAVQTEAAELSKKFSALPLDDDNEPALRKFGDTVIIARQIANLNPVASQASGAITKLQAATPSLTTVEFCSQHLMEWQKLNREAAAKLKEVIAARIKLIGEALVACQPKFQTLCDELIDLQTTAYADVKADLVSLHHKVSDAMASIPVDITEASFAGFPTLVQELDQVLTQAEQEKLQLVRRQSQFAADEKTNLLQAYEQLLTTIGQMDADYQALRREADYYHDSETLAQDNDQLRKLGSAITATKQLFNTAHYEPKQRVEIEQNLATYKSQLDEAIARYTQLARQRKKQDFARMTASYEGLFTAIDEFVTGEQDEECALLIEKIDALKSLKQEGQQTLAQIPVDLDAEKLSTCEEIFTQIEATFPSLVRRFDTMKADYARCAEEELQKQLAAAEASARIAAEKERLRKEREEAEEKEKERLRLLVLQKAEDERLAREQERIQLDTVNKNLQSQMAYHVRYFGFIGQLQTFLTTLVQQGTEIRSQKAEVTTIVDAARATLKNKDLLIINQHIDQITQQIDQLTTIKDKFEALLTVGDDHEITGLQGVAFKPLLLEIKALDSLSPSAIPDETLTLSPHCHYFDKASPEALQTFFDDYKKLSDSQNIGLTDLAQCASESASAKQLIESINRQHGELLTNKKTGLFSKKPHLHLLTSHAEGVAELNDYIGCLSKVLEQLKKRQEKLVAENPLVANILGSDKNIGDLIKGIVNNPDDFIDANFKNSIPTLVRATDFNDAFLTLFIGELEQAYQNLSQLTEDRLRKLYQLLSLFSEKEIPESHKGQWASLLYRLGWQMIVTARQYKLSPPSRMIVPPSNGAASGSSEPSPETQSTRQRSAVDDVLTVPCDDGSGSRSISATPLPERNTNTPASRSHASTIHYDEMFLFYARAITLFSEIAFYSNVGKETLQRLCSLCIMEALSIPPTDAMLKRLKEKFDEPPQVRPPLDFSAQNSAMPRFVAADISHPGYNFFSVDAKKASGFKAFTHSFVDAFGEFAKSSPRDPYKKCPSPAIIHEQDGYARRSKVTGDHNRALEFCGRVLLRVHDTSGCDDLVKIRNSRGT